MIWAVTEDGKGHVGKSFPPRGLTLPVNIPPEVKIPETSPESHSPVEVRCGETVTATVTATDPDGDPITLTKTFGPGTFTKASGTWSWTPWGRDPWQLVGFKATDKEA